MAQASADATQPAASKAAKPQATRTRAPDPRRDELRGEMVGLVLTAAAVAFGLALVTYAPRDLDVIQAGSGGEVQNWIGPVGARIADLLLQLFGVGAFGLVLLLAALAVRTLMGRVTPPQTRTMLGILGMALSTLLLLHLSAKSAGWRPFGKDAVGLLPGAVAVLCKALLSTVGTVLLAVLMLATSLAAITGKSLTRSLLLWLTGRAAPVVGQAATSGAHVAAGSWASLRHHFSSRKRKAALEPYGDDDMPDLADADAILGPSSVEFRVADLDPRAERPAQSETSVLRGRAPLPAERADLDLGERLAPADLTIPALLRRERDEASVRVRLPSDAHAVQAEVHPEHALEITPEPLHLPVGRTAEMPALETRLAHAELERVAHYEVPQSESPAAPGAFALPPLPPAGPAPVVDVEALAPVAPTATASAKGPRIVETEALRAPPPPARMDAVQGQLGIDGTKTWLLPPSAMLQEPPERQVSLDATALRENAQVLEQKLAEFNIQGEVTDIRPGPVVTTYEFRPAPGIKISKIVNLRDDLTMSLSALRVRIVAPIPGRDVVGIEVPNRSRQLVYFREIVDSPVFRESGSPLTLILGKDIEGRPVCTDLARAPHLLVAGATGTGKSVGINTFICSMLYRCSPDEVKFVFIDPKILELSVYEGIPHLLLPVLDEPRKAELALKWAVQEMDRRYKLLAAVEVRNLAGYKQKLPELRAQALRRRADAARIDLEGTPSDECVDLPEDLPYIVVVIDEFADLIMAAGKEVEIPVARLAQKARAAGIHVILATQRPSVDVLTGVIKANFPSRVSFQVSQAMDSKVVLDAMGAETLLGKGDMLFRGPTDSHLRRCHGTWITDDEVVALAKHWKDQGAPAYDMDILKDPEVESAAGMDDGELDPLYDEAVRMVVDANQASVSFLQRKLGIGYGRSAKIVDTMEARGIVGPSRGPNKPREILVNHL